MLLQLRINKKKKKKSETTTFVFMIHLALALLRGTRRVEASIELQEFNSLRVESILD